MPMTLEQIVEETRHWPPERVGELLDRLTGDLHGSEPEIQATWKTEIDRRVAEIETGKVKGIPAEAISARIQKLLKRRRLALSKPIS